MQNLTVKHLNPNHVIINLPDGEYFMSYGILIAYRDNDGRVSLSEQNWDYSNTTGRYRNTFLREKKATTQNRIENGLYSTF